MANKPRIYVDSCCFIDVVKHTVGKLPFDRENDNWFVKKLLEASRAGDIQLFTSILSIGECVSVEKGQSDVPSEVQEQFRALLTSAQYIRLVSPTPKTANVIQELRWKHKLVLGSPDAIHLASALEVKCTEFITSDERLQKTKFAPAVILMPTLGMSLIKPSQTGELPVEYTQASIFDAAKAN